LQSKAKSLGDKDADQDVDQDEPQSQPEEPEAKAPVSPS
jgi:membrane protein